MFKSLLLKKKSPSQFAGSKNEHGGKTAHRTVLLISQYTTCKVFAISKGNKQTNLEMLSIK
jgi:hypothetical protein